MTQTIAARIAAQHREDLHRLADQADHAGVRILTTTDGESLATSPADPTLLYRLTPDSCSCLHFTCFGRCIHHSLHLAELGLISEDADAALVALVDDRFAELVDDGDVPADQPSPLVLVIRDGVAAAA